MAAVSTATTEVRFDRLQFATTRATAARAAPCHLALTLAAASAELVWCPAASAALTAARVPAARVAGLVRAGRLWTSSGGRAVELVVHVQVTDDGRTEAEARRKRRRRPPPRPPPQLFLDRLADAVTAWRGWEDELGLSVTVRQRDDGESGEAAAATTLRFLVSKPATPGGLCAPPVPASYSRNDGDGDGDGDIGIPHAQLRRVVCQLVYDALPAEVVAATAAADTAARLRDKKRKPAAKPCRVTRGGATTRQQPSRPQPIRSRRLGIAPPSLSAAELLEIDGEGPGGTSPWPGAVALLEAVLSTLVGVRRRVLGVRPVSWTTMAPPAGGGRQASGAAAAGGTPRLLACSVSSSPYTSLLDMAPSVWNAHYGQAVAARAALIPTLCRLLATSGTSAQAPSLRRKVSATGRLDAAGMVATIETRLHELVLKEVPAQPSRHAVRRRCAAKERGGRAGGKAGDKPRKKGGLSGPDTDTATAESCRGVCEVMDDAHPLALHPTPPPDDDADERTVFNICMDNLDEILAPSEDGESENDSTGEDQEAGWKEIEAFSELDGWPADHDSDCEHGWDDDGKGDDFSGLWLPPPYNEGTFGTYEHEEGGTDFMIDENDSSYVDEYCDEQDTGCADWQDVEDWQLEAWAGGGVDIDSHTMRWST